MVLEPKESVYDNPQHAQQQAIIGHSPQNTNTFAVFKMSKRRL